MHAEDGARVLAVAAGPPGRLRVIGLIGLADPPRRTSREVIERLAAMGIRTVLVTGDSLPTARAVAEQVEIRGEAGSSVPSVARGESRNPSFPDIWPSPLVLVRVFCGPSSSTPEKSTNAAYPMETSAFGSPESWIETSPATNHL